MPTGYTADIKDGISFEGFLMGCARGFGALLPMRDLPSDAPIPERFEASPYHLDQLIKARNLLRWYEGLSSEEVETKNAEEFAKAEQQRFDSWAENVGMLEAYAYMLERAKAWEPPSEDHVSIKEFMIKQIEESAKGDDNTEWLAKSTPVQTNTEWLEAKKRAALQDIEYHRTKWAEEVQRTEQRNHWLKQLRDSLK